MFPHWEYVLHELFGRVQSVQAHVRHPHPAALGRAGQAVRRHRRRRRLRHLRARGRRRRPDQLLLGRARQPRRARRVPGRRHPRLAPSPGCATAASSTARPPPSRSGTPTSRPPRPSATSGRRCPTTSEFDNGFKAQWELFLRHVVARRALPLGPAGRRPRRPARRAGPEVLGRGPPPRRTGAHAVTDPPARRERRPASLRRRREPSPRHRRRRSPPASVFAAAHVVADPYADVARTPPPPSTGTPRSPSAATCGRHGLGVAEAMDTAQRGMGLDWAGAPELIRRSRRRGQGGRRPDRLRRRAPTSSAGRRHARRGPRRLRGAARPGRGRRRAGRS